MHDSVTKKCDVSSLFFFSRSVEELGESMTVFLLSCSCAFICCISNPSLWWASVSALESWLGAYGFSICTWYALFEVQMPEADRSSQAFRKPRCEGGKLCHIAPWDEIYTSGFWGQVFFSFNAPQKNHHVFHLMHWFGSYSVVFIWSHILPYSFIC